MFYNLSPFSFSGLLCAEGIHIYPGRQHSNPAQTLPPCDLFVHSAPDPTCIIQKQRPRAFQLPSIKASPPRLLTHRTLIRSEYRLNSPPPAASPELNEVERLHFKFKNGDLFILAGSPPPTILEGPSSPRTFPLSDEERNGIAQEIQRALEELFSKTPPPDYDPEPRKRWILDSTSDEKMEKTGWTSLSWLPSLSQGSHWFYTPLPTPQMSTSPPYVSA
ncbi:hypothetical protein BT69DRAFT_1337965 [Atractiella rhizophila]|nr:hypothetical protein BT69DRAFT_1337965 [Atractiella rhizophila]